MRHGQAEELAGRDKDRALTADGRLESSLMARWLIEQGGTFQRALVSPYLRAQQTFTQVNALLNLTKNQVETLEDLTPHGHPDAVEDYLNVLAEEGVKSVLIVSHMPLVSFLVESLDVKHVSPMFSPSAIARVDYDPVSQRGHLSVVQDVTHIIA
jgi:phosphohistidine phosphatase